MIKTNNLLFSKIVLEITNGTRFYKENSGADCDCAFTIFCGAPVLLFGIFNSGLRSRLRRYLPGAIIFRPVGALIN
ncbi:MAG: hypothetical protein DRI54_03370 [Bacteroidetes bacterium]|nr:MAG: hypothetical protein DRI54_03370 [Bacteroidota bacterium]